MNFAQDERHRTLTICAALAVIAILVCSTTASAEDKTVETYRLLKPSLALVATYRDDRLLKTGTAFCISSGGGRVIYLTNRHVIEGGNRIVLIRQYPRVELMRATVLRIGSGARDVALLAARHGPIPAVALSEDLPAEGTRIGIAGYPRTQLIFGRLGLGLSASLHTGTVNALPVGGFYLEYDAQTEPGNSGGPVFDLDTGRVEGIVVLKVGQRESNLAIAMPEVLAIATNAHLPVHTAIASLVDASRGADGAGEAVLAIPTPTPSPSPSPMPTASIDVACQSGLSDFYAAFEAWRGAFNRYIASSAQTTAGASGVTNRFGAIGLQITVSYEIKAIRSVVNAEEPKLAAAQSSIEVGKASETAQVTDGILRAIRRVDQDDLNWSNQRQNLIANLANGGTGFTVDKSLVDDARDQQSTIDDGFSKLKFMKACMATPAT